MGLLIEKMAETGDMEVIVVESNSTDGTRELVRQYEGHRDVRVVLQDTPRGKGNAVREGLRYASGEVVIIQDADLEYDLNDYEALLEPIHSHRYNFVIGTRHGTRGSAWKTREFDGARGLTFFFNFGHVLFLALFNFFYKQKLTDPFSMFKVFRRDCLAGLDFECDRFDFDFELAIKLLRKGYRPLEIPVNYRSRSLAEGKKVTLIRDPLTWLRALWRFRKSPLYRFDQK
jgi:glycosyltransferase involved in cell wall biosynthesis